LEIQKKQVFQVVAFLILAALTFGVISCSVKQEAYISTDGSGKVSFKFAVEDFFVQTIRDMTEFLGEENSDLPKGQIYDVEQMKKDFDENEGVDLIRLESPKTEVLEGEFRFQNIEEVFSREEELTQAGMLTFRKKGDVYDLQVRLERDTFPQLYDFAPILKTPFFEMFGPMENAGVSKEEYLEMLEYALGEKGPPGVLNSEIKLTVNVEGEVLDQQGGKFENGKVVFRIPLIKVLVLNEPLEYGIQFR